MECIYCKVAIDKSLRECEAIGKEFKPITETSCEAVGRLQGWVEMAAVQDSGCVDDEYPRFQEFIRPIEAAAKRYAESLRQVLRVRRRAHLCKSSATWCPNAV
jgi:hypothetical protein